MEKIAAFIVRRRFIMLIVTLVAVIFCGLLALRVEVNSDMAKYLPDDSPMRYGLDVMDDEFPDREDYYTVRIMFTGLPDDQKQAIKTDIESIPYVDSVEYTADSADYNKGDYTLYILQTLFEYHSDEMASIESALEERFSSYTMVYKRDEPPGTGLTPFIIAIAIGFATIILLAMCASWLEPFLFFAAVGAAVVINMGTNLFLGNISYVTASISSVLQLALSMDYSIMLLNRYRQELTRTADKYEAMTHALTDAFAAISSSSLTTIAGLLALVFMNFKIGKDLGLVMAKGIFFCLLCIFTLLPGLILMCDAGIRKTAKKTLHIHMGAISRFSYRFRHAIAVCFIILFVGAFVMQGHAQISYSMEEPDPIAAIFPVVSTVLVLFDNQDESDVTEIAAYLENETYVKDVVSFSTTIGKAYTAAALAEELEGMDDVGTSLDVSVLDMLYYYYYEGGETGPIGAGDFLRFLVDDVVTNETFAPYMDKDITDNLDMLSVFSDREALTAPRSDGETASLFHMVPDDVRSLMAYYFSEYGGVGAGTMTLREFVDFIRSDILADEDFGDLLDEEMSDRIDTLTQITDADEIRKPKSAAEISADLDMDADDMEMLMMLYQAQHGAADDLKLTFPQFADLLLDEILADSRFDEAIDTQARADADKLALFADPARFQAPLPQADLADELGIAPDQAELLYSVYFGQHGAADDLRLTFPQFADLLLDEILTDSRFDGAIDAQARTDADKLALFAEPARFQEPLPQAELADALGMAPDQAELLYAAYFGQHGAVDELRLTFLQFARLLLDEILKDSRFDEAFDEKTRRDIGKLDILSDARWFQTPYASDMIAEALGMEPDQAELLYMLYFAQRGAVDEKTMGLSDFVSLLVDEMKQDYRFADQFYGQDSTQLEMLRLFGRQENFMAAYTADEFAALFGLDAGTVDLLYAFCAASLPGVDPGKMEIATFVRFLPELIAANPAFAAMLAPGQMEQLTVLSSLTDEMMLQTPFDDLGMTVLLDNMGMTLAPGTVAWIYAGAGGKYVPPVATLTLAEFIDRLVDVQGASAPSELIAMQRLIQAVLYHIPLCVPQMAALTGMDTGLLAPLYLYHMHLYAGYDFPAIPLYHLISFVVNAPLPPGFGGAGMAEMPVLLGMMDAVLAQAQFTPKEMAAMLGMAPDMTKLLYAYDSILSGDTGGWEVSLLRLANFVVNELAEGDYADSISESDIRDMDRARELMLGVLSERLYGAADLAALVDMDPDAIRTLYAYYKSIHGDTGDWLLSAQALVDYVLDDEAMGEFGGAIGEKERKDLEKAQTLMRSALSGQAYTAVELAALVDMAPDTIRVLYGYRMSSRGDTDGWRLSVQGLVDFVLEDLAAGEYSGALGEQDRKDLERARTLMRSTSSEQLYTSAELAALVDMDPDMIRILYAYDRNLYGDTGGWMLSLLGLVDYALDSLATDKNFGDMLDGEALDDLRSLRDIMAGALAGTSYPPGRLAALLDIDPDMPETLYLLRISRYGDTTDWRLPVQTFVRFIHDDVLTDADLSGFVGDGEADRLEAANRLVDAVMTGTRYAYGEMAGIFEGLTEEMSPNRVKLLYVYYFSQKDGDTDRTFTVIDLFHYLADDILVDPVFVDLFSAEDRQTLLDAEKDLDDAVKLLSGPHYSLMMINTTFPGDSEDTDHFIDSLIRTFDGELSGNYYLIGRASMNYEMSQAFGGENFFISILTAIAVFLVVAATFRSLAIPAVLVLLIQCSVFVTVSIIWLQGYRIYYLALLIVQCILMGATIDYGILFVSYYRESRQSSGPAQALAAAYDGSIHTIMTSGLILVIVIGLLGIFFENPVIGQICQTISRGALCSAILVIFILPGLLATCDRWVGVTHGQKKAASPDSERSL